MLRCFSLYEVYLSMSQSMAVVMKALSASTFIFNLLFN